MIWASLKLAKSSVSSAFNCVVLMACSCVLVMALTLVRLSAWMLAVESCSTCAVVNALAWPALKVAASVVVKAATWLVLNAATWSVLSAATCAVLITGTPAVEMALICAVLRARRRGAVRYTSRRWGIRAEFFVLICAVNGEFGAEPADAGEEKWLFLLKVKIGNSELTGVVPQSDHLEGGIRSMIAQNDP